MANQTVTIKTRYTHKTDKGTLFPKDNPKAVSRTQQHFLKETNINSIMAKFKKSGLLTNPLTQSTIMPQFGDFTNISDYQTLQNKLASINSYFENLPAETRREFDNDPQKLMQFVSNPENKEKAIKLGLLSRDLTHIKYTKTLEDGSIVDCTDEVIANRGLFVNGKRVNKDGTLYQEVQEVPVVPETPVIPEV